MGVELFYSAVKSLYKKDNESVNDPNPARKTQEVINCERNMLVFLAGLYDKFDVDWSQNINIT